MSLSSFSVLHSSSWVAQYYSPLTFFWVTSETSVEGIIWPFIVILGSLDLDLGFSFIFRIAFRVAHLGTLGPLRHPRSTLGHLVH